MVIVRRITQIVNLQILEESLKLQECPKATTPFPQYLKLQEYLILITSLPKITNLQIMQECSRMMMKSQ